MTKVLDVNSTRLNGRINLKTVSEAQVDEILLFVHVIMSGASFYQCQL